MLLKCPRPLLVHFAPYVLNKPIHCFFKLLCPSSCDWPNWHLQWVVGMITLGVGLIRINTGQVQRINSVLFSIQVYWASFFLLPGQVIKNVEQIIRSFLCSGSDMRTIGAKVAWNHVSLPKKEGGGG